MAASFVNQLSQLDPETIELQLDGTTLTIRVNRPKALNALSPQVIDEMRAVVGLVRESLTGTEWPVRGVIITGAGPRSFVAGGDIAQMNGMDPTAAAAYAAEAQELTTWLETLPVLVIAAVNGFALGGGCELAMACDVILASENASFGQPEVALGLIPGFGGSVRLPRYVGAAAARELILTGRRIDAAEAAQLGLVSRILPDHGKLIEAAHEMIDLSAGQSPVAVAAAKRVLREAGSLSIDAGLEVERAAFAACFDTADMAEGTAAFVEKRRPEFPGR
ncbi:MULTISPECIES: enoyl-CoA hydratase/isomerase family protein [unclassified Leucobacter]|uniref:enoyl-CoA hydratase/isomerase family protein n=1 Tax=unclassified Leucobacter TaxID=2621730 RepID=UPI00165E1D15|nr:MULTISPECIES: enoyl-CoA hydratase-related protein [unclassified Leucobacter]MBC9926506.1 enoyl-CoA hydratase/isomerase family protein [Leucobacter sp. cx-169]